MNGGYLDAKAKEFYRTALEHIRDCDDNFWSLDGGLDDPIDRINQNSGVQTMYSRNGRFHLGDPIGSYLKVCYSYANRDAITNYLVPKLREYFAQIGECDFSVENIDPEKRVEEEGVNDCLKFINDESYFNIHHIRFGLISWYSEHHNIFWKELSEMLSEI